MSGDEEEDYMSDAFLAHCVQEDVRPGLKRVTHLLSQLLVRSLQSHALERDHRLAKKKSSLEDMAKQGKLSKASLKTIENENRQIGLSTSIDSSNKGFAMLQKMGYKAGQSLGKSNEGRLEPIPIHVKSDRAGLGRENVIKAIQMRREARMRDAQSKALDTNKFRAHQSLQRRLHHMQGDLQKSQRVCQDLELAVCFESPVVSWFWPKPPKPEAEDDDNPIDDEDKEEEGCDLEPEDQLTILTSYLRQQYFYCLWCGHSFSDDVDLSANCPGPSRDDHDE